LGQILMQKEYKNLNSEILPMNEFAAGLYIIKVSSPGFSRDIRFVKTN